MIVPMKKVSLIVLAREKEAALKRLRKLGLLHIEMTEGSGEKLLRLRQQAAVLEQGIAISSEFADKTTDVRPADTAQAYAIAEKLLLLTEEKKQHIGTLMSLQAEYDRVKEWGELDPNAFSELREKGICVSLYETAPVTYREIAQTLDTLVLSKTKASVRFAVVTLGDEGSSEALAAIRPYRFRLPERSSVELRVEVDETERKIAEIDMALHASAVYLDSMKAAAAAIHKDVEFENYVTGIAGEALSETADPLYDVVYFTGYLPADALDTLKAAAKESAWGLTAEDPTPDDDVPTKLHNNKFVSLIYPLTDFLGTVPGYFEYDISAWFLGFILVFFGIIFGDGGYGLLICAAAGALILKETLAKKPIPSAYFLILLMGGATIVWGILTCTWFGIDPAYLPGWLRSISLPVISNVYADKLWYPFWTNGEAALTTTQNLQILCFALALVQLSAAHIKGMIRNRKSLKLLGDLGSVLQLIGIFYVVLALVVNGAVFGLGLVIAGIPVGTVAIALVGVGFALSFVFSNYEGNLGESILTSLKNIVSCLLGVVNMFSDIVSYIRLWAVGLAGAAISATVNDLAGPFLGNFMFMIVAILLLVFGHGLNMILNVLSVIVHGVRLNTLEFSSHLDMSWSGHKYQPFEE